MFNTLITLIADNAVLTAIIGFILANVLTALTNFAGERIQEMTTAVLARLVPAPKQTTTKRRRPKKAAKKSRCAKRRR